MGKDVDGSIKVFTVFFIVMVLGFFTFLCFQCHDDMVKKDKIEQIRTKYGKTNKR